MLGRAVSARAVALGHETIALTRADLDITSQVECDRSLESHRPDAVVNCAAWTDVDGAEEHRDASIAVNGDGAGNVARAAAEVTARVIQVSTDYVFDGTHDEPWLESDTTNPLSVYGVGKLHGEEQVAAATPRHAIVRTSWLFGDAGSNFVETMLRLGSQRDEIAVVTDQVGCPTWTRHLAEGIVELAEREEFGIHHLAGAGSCSWNEFALEIFDQAQIDCRVLPTDTIRFPRPAPRPAYSVLGSERAEPVTLPAWQEGLRAYLSQRKVGAPT